MESSSDDDGESGAGILTKAIFLFCIVLPFSVYKSHPTVKSVQTKAALEKQTVTTVSAKPSKPKKKNVPVQYPGENVLRKRKDHLQNGIPVDDTI